MFMLHVWVAVALVAANALAGPAHAQNSKPDSSGTGGAAGYSPAPPDLPDMSRGMGAPNPDFESPPSAAPMNAPPADAEKKDDGAPPPEEAKPTE